MLPADAAKAPPVMTTDLPGQLIAEPALRRRDPHPGPHRRRRTEMRLRAPVGFGLSDERRYRPTTVAWAALRHRRLPFLNTKPALQPIPHARHVLTTRIFRSCQGRTTCVICCPLSKPRRRSTPYLSAGAPSASYVLNRDPGCGIAVSVDPGESQFYRRRICEERGEDFEWDYLVVPREEIVRATFALFDERASAIKDDRPSSGQVE